MRVCELYAHPHSSPNDHYRLLLGAVQLYLEYTLFLRRVSWIAVTLPPVNVTVSSWIVSGDYIFENPTGDTQLNITGKVKISAISNPYPGKNRKWQGGNEVVSRWHCDGNKLVPHWQVSGELVLEW